MMANDKNLDSFCTADELREKLKLHIKEKYRFQYLAAQEWKCSPPFVNAVMLGHRDLSPTMLEEIGYVKVKGYSWKPGPGPRTLLVQTKKNLMKAADSPIKILWRAGDDEEHQRVTTGLRASLRMVVADKYGSRIKAASAWACSTGLVSHVLTGTKMPSEAMLNDLGLQKITGYRRVPAADKKAKEN